MVARLRQILIGLMPVLFIGLLIGVRFTAYDLYFQLVQEDSFFEYLQFVFYFITALYLGATGYFSVLNRNVKLAALCLLGAAILAFVAFEEISWGQRLVNLENPEYFAQHNIQSEISIHNLDTFQPLVHGAYMILGLALAGSRAIGELLSRKIARLKPLLVFAPQWYLASYFLPVTGVYAILEFFKPFGILINNTIPVMMWRDQEPVETVLALGILMQMVLVFKTLKENNFTISFDVPELKWGKGKKRAFFKI